MVSTRFELLYSYGSYQSLKDLPLEEKNKEESVKQLFQECINQMLTNYQEGKSRSKRLSSSTLTQLNHDTKKMMTFLRSPIGKACCGFTTESQNLFKLNDDLILELFFHTPCQENPNLQKQFDNLSPSHQDSIQEALLFLGKNSPIDLTEKDRILILENAIKLSEDLNKEEITISERDDLTSLHLALLLLLALKDPNLMEDILSFISQLPRNKEVYDALTYFKLRTFALCWLLSSPDSLLNTSYTWIYNLKSVELSQFNQIVRKRMESLDPFFKNSKVLDLGKNRSLAHLYKDFLEDSEAIELFASLELDPDVFHMPFNLPILKPLMRLLLRLPQQHAYILRYAAWTLSARTLNRYQPFFEWMEKQARDNHEMGLLLEDSLTLIETDSELSKFVTSLPSEKYPLWQTYVKKHTRKERNIDSFIQFLRDECKEHELVKKILPWTDNTLTIDRLEKLFQALPEAENEFQIWLLFLLKDNQKELPENWQKALAMTSLTLQYIVWNQLNWLEQNPSLFLPLMNWLKQGRGNLLFLASVSDKVELIAKNNPELLLKLFQATNVSNEFPIRFLRTIASNNTPEDMRGLWDMVGSEIFSYLLQTYSNNLNLLRETFSKCDLKLISQLLQTEKQHNTRLILCLFQVLPKLTSSVITALNDETFRNSLVEFDGSLEPQTYSTLISLLKKEKLENVTQYLNILRGHQSLFTKLFDSFLDPFKHPIFKAAARYGYSHSIVVHLVNRWQAKGEKYVKEFFELAEAQKWDLFEQKIECDRLSSSLRDQLVLYTKEQKIHSLSSSVVEENDTCHSVFEKLLNFMVTSSLKEVSLALTDCLFDQNQVYNAKNIPLIRSHSTYANLPVSKDVKEHFEHIFDFFLSYSEFEDYLSHLKVPQDPSFRRLIQIFFKIKEEEMTVQHVQRLVISGFLCPTFQGDLGSCFGTNLIIQQESTPWGLRQIAKDYASLLSTGGLERLIYNENGTQEKVVFESRPDAILTHQGFMQDHLLNRIREYMIASMEPKSSSLDEDIIQVFSSYDSIGRKLQKAFKNSWDFPQEEFKTLVKKEISSHLKIFYDATATSPLPPHDQGAWILIRRQDNQVIKSLVDYQECLISILEKSSKQLQDKYSQFKEAIQEGTKEGVQFIRSYALVCRLFDTWNRLHPNQPLVNPATELDHIDDKPWLKFCGGFSEPIFKNYYEQQEVTKLDFIAQDANQICENLLSYIQGLPSTIKEFCRVHPRTLLPLSMPGHALSLRPSGALNLLHEKEMSTSSIIKTMQEEAKQWAKKTLVSGQDFKNFLKEFETPEFKIPEDNPMYLWAQTLGEKTVEEILSLVKTKWEELLNISSFNIGIQESFVAYLIGLPQHAKSRPLSLILGHTNWKSTSYLVAMGSPVTGKLMLVRADLDINNCQLLSEKEIAGKWSLMNQPVWPH